MTEASSFRSHLGPLKEDAPPSGDVLDLLLDAVCLVDSAGRFVFVSAACERIFGYDREEMTGRYMQEMIHPEDLERTLEAADRVLGGEPLEHFENRYIRKDGQVVYIMWSARWSEADQLRMAVARDVTDRKQAEVMQAALYAISEAAYAAEDLLALFQRVHRVVGEVLPSDHFVVALYDDKTAEWSVPYPADGPGSPPPRAGLNLESLSAEVLRNGRALLLSPDARRADEEQRRMDPEYGVVHWLGVPLVASGEKLGVLAVQSNREAVGYGPRDEEFLQFVATQVALAIERKRVESRLQRAALYDPLTNLPNRLLLHDRLQNALVLAQRAQLRLSLLYLDLDGFKAVNDGHGHTTGDLLLQEVGRRLKEAVRESDTVGRIGGDEFLILLAGIDYPHDTLTVAEKIRASLGQPYQLKEVQLRLSTSIGVAACPQHGKDGRELIHAADGAMYEAKKAGGNQVRQAVPGGEGRGLC